MNWYKTAQVENNWTNEELRELEILSEAVDGLERNDRLAKIHVLKNEIGKSNLFFSIQSAYSVDTQLETMWDKFTNSLYIEKVASDYFEVNINEQGFKHYDNFESVRDIVSRFPNL